MTNHERYNDNNVTTTTSNHHHSTSTGTGAHAHAHAREAESKAAMLRGQYLDCCEYYVRSFRRAVVPVIQRDIAVRIKDGMTAEVIMAAMDETQTAPRPSWAYCAAILRRCDAEGIRTLNDWQRSKEQYASSRNPALQYSQREYTADMFGADFFIDPKSVLDMTNMCSI